LGQSSNTKGKSIYGHLMASSKAKDTRKSAMQQKPVVKPKKDAWYRNPGQHRYEGANGPCTHCGMQKTVHRGENECYEEWLMRIGRAAR